MLTPLHTFCSPFAHSLYEIYLSFIANEPFAKADKGVVVRCHFSIHCAIVNIGFGGMIRKLPQHVINEIAAG
jgi:hypothetical protein